MDVVTDQRDEVPWYAWLFAPFLSFLIMTLILVAAAAVLIAPFLVIL